MYMSSGVPESGERTEEISEGIMDENISKFDENHKLTDQKLSKPNPRNMKKMTLKQIIIKLLKTSNKQKILEAAR